MPKPTTTELQWKLDALERKVVALTDLIAFMLAHLGSTSPDAAALLAQQLRALQQIDGAEVAPELLKLGARLESSLGEQQQLDLESIRPAPEPR